MEIARDFQDHQLLDCREEACGRVDDILIRWDHEVGELGPVLCGGAIMLDQLGVLGRLLRPLLRAAGGDRSIEIPWSRVSRVEPHAVHLSLPRERLGLAEIDPS